MPPCHMRLWAERSLLSVRRAHRRAKERRMCEHKGKHSVDLHSGPTKKARGQQAPSASPVPSTQPGVGRGPRSLGTPAADPPHTRFLTGLQGRQPCAPCHGDAVSTGSAAAFGRAEPTRLSGSHIPPGLGLPGFAQGVTGFLGPQLNKEQEELRGWNDHGH